MLIRLVLTVSGVLLFALLHQTHSRYQRVILNLIPGGKIKRNEMSGGNQEHEKWTAN